MRQASRGWALEIIEMKALIHFKERVLEKYGCADFQSYGTGMFGITTLG